MPLDIKVTNPANPKDFRFMDAAALAKDHPSDPAWLKAEKQRRRGGKPPVARAAPRVPAIPPRGKAMPALPSEVMTGLHPTGLTRQTIRAEFEALYEWVKSADKAPGQFTVRQEVARDDIADRVELLRPYAYT